MTNAKKNLNEILVFFISITPLGFLIADTISGFFMLTGRMDISLSIFYKFFFISSCVCYLFSCNHNNKINRLLVLGVFLYISLWGAILVFTDRSDHFFVSIIELFKLFSIYIIFYCLITLPYKAYVTLNKFFSVTLFVVLFNVFASLAGFGNNSYGDYGAKGFLFGGNALSGIIVILSTYYLVKFYDKGLFLFFMCTLFFVLLSFVVGTKSSILGVMLGALLVVLIKGNYKSYLILFLVLFLTLFIGSLTLEYLQSTAMYSRLSYFYEVGGLEQLIFSGRLDFLVKIWAVFERQDVLTLSFGLNQSLLVGFEQQISEMDITDIILSFGFVTLFIYLLLLVFTLVYIVRVSKGNVMNSTVISSFLLVTIGAIAGHVLFNGVITPYWGVLLALPILDTKYQSYNNI